MMDKFVKTLKTTKRRISQQLKVATGQAEMTRDAEFDLAYRDFADLGEQPEVAQFAVCIHHPQCGQLVRHESQVGGRVGCTSR